MPTPHTVLELRSGRDAEHTPETAVQILSALPQLKDKLLIDKLTGTHEKLSFEFFVWNQTIYFLCFLPTRLVDYMASLFQSSYPEILITPLDQDPLQSFNLGGSHDLGFIEQHSKYLSLGELRLKEADYYPLKNYLDFTDVDPLATVLATLSKSQALDKVAVQLVVKNGGNGWKRAGLSAISSATSSSQDVSERLTQALTQARPQKQLIEKKLNSRSLAVTIRLVVSSNSPDRSELLLETVATAFGSITQSEGNSLELRRVRLFRSSFLKQLQNRQTRFWGVNHLSLEEVATLFHLPNKSLSHIPNIAWGKNLLGEPPENLPVVARGMDPELKRDINPFARTTYKNETVTYGLRRSDRRRHFYVIGKTGTGKSTLLANMAISDLKNNEGLCVIDPHGDLVETILNYIPSHRINDVVYFDPSDPERNVQINLFEGQNIEHRELIASGIVSIFQKLYSYSWGPRLEYILRNALLTLLKSETSRLSDILTMLTNQKFRKKMVEKLDDKILKSFWLDEFDKMHDRQRTDAIAPILNKVGQFVSSPLVRDVVNARKSSFNKILSEARKYRLNLILANQYIAQIPEEVQKAIFGNCGSVASFIMGAEDSAVFAKEYGEKYTQEDLVSLARYQVINKITIDNVVSRPFPAFTLPLAKSFNQNREKVIRVSRERYARKKSA